MRAPSRVQLGVIVLLALAITASLLPSAAAEPTVGAPSASTITKIHTFLDGEVAQRGLPGAEFALVDGQSVLDLHAFGVADGNGRPLTPHTPMLLASLTKNLTATAILQLVESGRIRLDAPVTTYLPWFRTRDPAESGKITVADLLHHTSGLPVNTPSENGALGDSSAGALERGIRRLDQVQLTSTPGTTFLYSNTNYNTLGLIVQTVSGEPYGQYVAQHVFVPAGMRDASVGPAPVGDPALGFYPWFGGRFRPTRVPTPGSMTPSAITYASAADLAQVLIMNLNGGQVGGVHILSAASVDRLQRPAVATDDFSAYAMGWNVRPGWEYDVPTRLQQDTHLPLLLEHQGSWPTTHTYLGFLPQDKLGFALLINANVPARESELDSLWTGVWRILAGQEPKDAPPSERPLQQYGWQVAGALVVVLLGSLVWSWWVVRRPRPGRPTRVRRRFLTLTGMLVLDLAVAALIWLYLPTAFDSTTVAIARSNPDIGLLLIAISVLTLGWAPVRTVLGVLAIVRGRSGRRDAGQTG